MNANSHAPKTRAFAIQCYAWSRAIHWATVALLSGLLVTALFEDIDPHGSGNSAFLWHSSLGIVVYLLSVSRFFLWLIYRPTASRVGEQDVRVHRGLRFAFYALLIALPVSGWWLASEEGMPAHVFGIPALPQWYNRDGAPHSASTHIEASRDNAAREDPAVRYLARLHASLATALGIVIALHVLSLIRTRKDRSNG